MATHNLNIEPNQFYIGLQMEYIFAEPPGSEKMNPFQ